MNKIINSQKIVNTDYSRCSIPSLVSNSKKLPENLPFGFNFVHNSTVYKILTRTRRRGKSATKFPVASGNLYFKLLMQILDRGY